MKKVSIIIPKYNPEKGIFDKVKEYLTNNAKDYEIIEIWGLNGLANAYNEGIKKSKGELIITLHQDCIPIEKDSLKRLIDPFKNPKVVMTYSKIIDYDSKKEYAPFIPDGKFNAFRKTALEKVGYFDEKTFFTGGEDVDIYFKLKKMGKIVLVNTAIKHEHPFYKGNKTIEKRRQNGSINGTLFRIYGFRFPLWYKSLIGVFIYPKTYGKAFLKSFINKKQDYRRKK